MIMFFNSSLSLIELLADYVDTQNLAWLVWILYPVLLMFVLPLFIVAFIYGSILFLAVYKRRNQIITACSQDRWAGARQILATIWDAQGVIWHGHEVFGLENLPDTGPALLIYYHGAIPIDMYYVVAKTILLKGRTIKAVGDKFLFKIPGFPLLMEAFGVIQGTVEEVVQFLKDGHLLAIAPGGVREAYFSDNYDLIWGTRLGFAKAAKQAKVPVIPVFTENVREAFRAMSWGRAFFRRVYEKTRLPIVPIYGMFPVKLRSYIGAPIDLDPDDSPEQISEKVQAAIRLLISQHQVRPGSICRALLQRIPYFDHKKQD